MIHERRGRPAPAMEPQLELRRPSRLSTARWARVEGLWRSALGEAADVVGAVSSRRRARLWLRPVRHTPVGAVPYPGLPCPVEFRCGEGDRALRPRPGGVWTHSSATNRRESRGQPKDRDSQGGPDRMRLAQTSGEAGARCHLWVYRAVYGRWPLSMRSGKSTVSTRPPSAPVLRMRLIPATGRGDSMQGLGTASPCPSAGRMGPTSQRLFQPRPHAVTSRRDRAANVRAGVPSAGDGRPGRPTIG